MVGHTTKPWGNTLHNGIFCQQTSHGRVHQLITSISQWLRWWSLWALGGFYSTSACTPTPSEMVSLCQLHREKLPPQMIPRTKNLNSNLSLLFNSSTSPSLCRVSSLPPGRQVCLLTLLPVRSVVLQPAAAARSRGAPGLGPKVGLSQAPHLRTRIPGHLAPVPGNLGAPGGGGPSCASRCHRS